MPQHNMSAKLKLPYISTSCMHLWHLHHLRAALTCRHITTLLCAHGEILRYHIFSPEAVLVVICLVTSSHVQQPTRLLHQLTFPGFLPNSCPSFDALSSRSRNVILTEGSVTALEMRRMAGEGLFLQAFNATPAIHTTVELRQHYLVCVYTTWLPHATGSRVKMHHTLPVYIIYTTFTDRSTGSYCYTSVPFFSNTAVLLAPISLPQHPVRVIQSGFFLPEHYTIFERRDICVIREISNCLHFPHMVL